MVLHQKEQFLIHTNQLRIRMEKTILLVFDVVKKLTTNTVQYKTRISK